jgi:kinesin family protein C1
LRGNIRVFARVRPFLPNDGLDLSCPPEPTITVRSDTNSLRILKSSSMDDDKVEDHSFLFDKVFGPSVSQETLFEEVSEFVQSALDGYNVCLFSYGQTGSGKVSFSYGAIFYYLFMKQTLQTHTMQGSGTGSMRGIIPRAMQQVGLYKNELECKGWEYNMEVSFVEIYNEDIKDLLRSGAHEHGKHEIKKDQQGGVYISDVTMVPVDPNNVEQIERYFKFNLTNIIY